MPLAARHIPRPPRPAGVLRRSLAGAVVALAGLSGAASAQVAAGSIGATLTVVRPVSTVAPQASALTVSPTGTIALHTGAPVTGPTSQLVMVTLSADADATDAPRVSVGTGATERVLVAGAAVPVGVDGLVPRAGASPDYQLAWHIRGVRDAGVPVRVRLSYLSVAGT